jgi:DNA-binding GntR family transcriptional regulator
MSDTIDSSQLALPHRAAERLRGMLIEGVIGPGAKLNERELSERLKISRTPLREAIKMLASEGLVELLPNRGAVALSLNEQDVMDTFEVMANLEAQSGELAATRITDEELAEIKALHYEMLACFMRRDLPRYYKLNAQIHVRINAAAKNPVLARTYSQLNTRLQALRFRSNQDGQKWQHAVREHEQMIVALEARDGAAMRKVLTEHLNNKRDAVLDLMRSGKLENVAAHH